MASEFHVPSGYQACDLCPVMSDDIFGGTVLFNDASCRDFTLLCSACCELSRKIFTIYQSYSPSSLVNTAGLFMLNQLKTQQRCAIYYRGVLADKDFRELNQQKQLFTAQMVGCRLYIAFKSGIFNHPCLRPDKTYPFHSAGSMKLCTTETKITKLSRKYLNIKESVLTFMLDRICFGGIGYPHRNAKIFESSPMPPTISLTANHFLLRREFGIFNTVCENCNESDSGKLQFCSGCYATKFCSKQCQVDFWEQHKSICKELQIYDKNLKQSTRRSLIK